MGVNELVDDLGW